MSVVPLGSHGPSRRRSLLDMLLDEAVELAEAVRDYISERIPQDVNAVNAVDRLRESAEISRITSRVSFSVAWLLSRRAVLAGEISHEESLDDAYRLGGTGICDVEGDLPSTAPSRFHGLSQRSHSLYTRIARLDRDLDGRAGPLPG